MRIYRLIAIAAIVLLMGVVCWPKVHNALAQGYDTSGLNVGGTDLQIVGSAPSPTSGKVLGLQTNGNNQITINPVGSVGTCPNGQGVNGVTNLVTGPTCLTVPQSLVGSGNPNGAQQCFHVGDQYFDTINTGEWTCTTAGVAVNAVWVLHGSTATATATATPTPSPSPTPIGGITPPSLVNQQTFQAGATFGGHTVHGDGVTDDTAAMNSAIGAGDVLVEPGSYAILGNVGAFGNNHHIQCVCSPSPCTTTAGANPNQFTINGTAAFFVNKTTSSFPQGSQANSMVGLGNGTGDTLFYCGFVGTNANVTGKPSALNVNQAFAVIFGSVASSGNEIVGNDFNGIGGTDAAVGQQGSDNAGSTIEYNTVEHCGYYGIQISASASATAVSFNSLIDCSGMVESNGSTDTGITANHNFLGFPFGPGCSAAASQVPTNGCSFSGLVGLTGGAAGAINYSGNTIENNWVGGNFSNGICENDGCIAAGATGATYTGNTCSTNCTINQYTD